MASPLEATLETLRAAREKSAAIVVSYSGGKDSLAVLDLCARTFNRVEAFFMYLVPGLRCTEAALDYGRQRWGITIRQYPHWLLTKYLKYGVYCPNFFTVDDLPEWKLRDVYDLVIADTGIPLIATGAKKADSLWRRRNLANVSHYEDVVYPIVEWSKFDVMSYLRAQAIPIPDNDGRNATGVDLSGNSLVWLAENHPEDYAKLIEVFPYAEAAVWRWRWYGVA